MRVLARLAAPVVLAGALVLSGCGDDDADPATDPAPVTDPAEGSNDDVTADAAEIVISGFSFGDPLTVAEGTTVTVRNDDPEPHTWTSVDEVFDSGLLASGDTFSFTFEDAGTFEFACSLHPQMTGSITVSS